MAEEETIRPQVDPSAALAGLALITASMTTMLTVATGVGAAFAAWQIGSSVFTSMRKAESQIIRLQTALQSATDGVAEYTRAMEFAAKTPFPVESVIEAAAQLRVFQVNPFEEVEAGGRNVLEVLGDMSGAMGKDVSTAVYALTRALTGEWEIMKNNFQISASMVPKLKGLTSGTKEYAKAIIDFLAEQKRFQGGMDLTAKSINGMLSNLGDAIDLMYMGAAGVADNTTLLKGATLYSSVREAIEKLYTVVSDDSAMKIFGQNMKFQNEQTQEALKRMKLTTEETKLMQQAWEQFPEDKVKRIDFLLSEGMDMSRVLSQGEKFTLWGRMFGQVMRVVFDVFIMPSFERMQSMIDAFLEKGVEVINMLVPIQKIPETTQLSAEQAHDIITQLAGDTSKLTGETIKEMEGMLIASKSRQERQMIIFMILMEIFKAIFLEVLADWKNKILGWIDDVTADFQRLFSHIFDMTEKYNLGERFLDMFSGVGEGVGSIFQGIGSFISGYIKGIVDNLISGGVIDSFAKYWGRIMDSIGAVGRAIGKIFGGESQGKLKEFGSMLTNIITIPLKLFARALDFIGSLIHTVAMGLEEWGIVDMLADTFDLLLDTVNEIVDAFSDATGAIMEAFGMSGGGGAVLETVGNILGKVILGALWVIVGAIKVVAYIVKGLAVVIGWVADAFAAIVGWIKQGVMFLAKVGVFIGLIGQMVGEKLLGGLKAVFVDYPKQGIDYVSGLGQKFKEWLMSIKPVNDAIKWMGDLWDGISDGIDSAYTSLMGLLDSADNSLTSITQPINQFFTDMASGIKGMYNGVLSWIQDKLDALGQWWESTAIGKAWKKAGDMIFGPPPGSENGDGSTSTTSSMAIGDWNVPRDMAALIHKGEMVIPRDEASAIRSLFTSPARTPSSAKVDDGPSGSRFASFVMAAMTGIVGSFKEFGQAIRELAFEVRAQAVVDQFIAPKLSPMATAPDVSVEQPSEAATPASGPAPGNFPIWLVPPGESDLTKGKEVRVKNLEEAKKFYKFRNSYTPNAKTPVFEPPPVDMNPEENANLTSKLSQSVAMSGQNAPGGGGPGYHINNYFQVPVTPNNVEKLDRKFSSTIENLRRT